jgi:hypothetical protein
LQSELAKQETQVVVAVLQSSLLALYAAFVLSAQSALERQPTQVFVVVLQTDFVGSLQSAEDTHSTHVLVPTLHAGFAVE